MFVLFIQLRANPASCKNVSFSWSQIPYRTFRSSTFPTAVKYCSFLLEKSKSSVKKKTNYTCKLEMFQDLTCFLTCEKRSSAFLTLDQLRSELYYFVFGVGVYSCKCAAITQNSEIRQTQTPRCEAQIKSAAAVMKCEGGSGCCSQCDMKVTITPRQSIRYDIKAEPHAPAQIHLHSFSLSQASSLRFAYLKQMSSLKKWTNEYFTTK